MYKYVGHPGYRCQEGVHLDQPRAVQMDREPEPGPEGPDSEHGAGVQTRINTHGLTVHTTTHEPAATNHGTPFSHFQTGKPNHHT